jgi:hypothetical protein
MPYLTMTPHMSVIRVYDKPGGYESRSPYLGLVMVTYLNDKLAYLHGAVGKIDRETLQLAFDMLREAGIEEVQMERHGRMKVIDLRTKNNFEPVAR